MPKDPFVRLRTVGEKLPNALRDEILALGPAAVPGLVPLLDARGRKDVAFHAIDLLVDLRAHDAIPALLALFGDPRADAGLLALLSNRLIELGPAVLEPALARLEESKGERRDLLAIADVLARLGLEDPRIFPVLEEAWREDDAFAAEALAEYGDPRGLALLEESLRELEIDPEDENAEFRLEEILVAYETLGGTVDEGLEARIQELRREIEELMPQGPVEPAPKRGRNDLCHCGSGKKYKKCHLDDDERRATEARKAAPTAEWNRRRPAEDLTSYAEPLLAATNGSKKAVVEAISVAEAFWNIAVLPDEAKRARAVEDLALGVPDEAEREELRAVAKMMIERHHQMFPA